MEWENRKHQLCYLIEMPNKLVYIKTLQVISTIKMAKIIYFRVNCLLC